MNKSNEKNASSYCDRSMILILAARTSGPSPEGVTSHRHILTSDTSSYAMYIRLCTDWPVIKTIAYARKWKRSTNPLHSKSHALDSVSSHFTRSLSPCFRFLHYVTHWCARCFACVCVCVRDLIVVYVYAIENYVLPAHCIQILCILYTEQRMVSDN